MKTKTIDYGDIKIEMMSVTLEDANTLFPFVASAMTKLLCGNTSGVFSDVLASDLSTVVKIVCKNSYRILEGGEKKPLAPSDLEEDVKEYYGFLLNFLEFNFGFFSKTR